MTHSTNGGVPEAKLTEPVAVEFSAMLLGEKVKETEKPPASLRR